MRLPTLSTVSVIICCIPVVALVVEVLSNQNGRTPSGLVWLLAMIPPYALLAGLSLVRRGRIWSGVLLASSVLLAASGLLAQLNVWPVGGFHGLGRIGFMVMQLYGCWLAWTVAAVAQALFRGSARRNGTVDRRWSGGDDSHGRRDIPES